MADRAKIQELEERVDKLEKDSHPPIGLCEFEGYKDLVKRIEELEEKIQTVLVE